MDDMQLEVRFQDEVFGNPSYRFENWMEDGLSEDDCWDHYYDLFTEWKVTQKGGQGNENG
ncbi:hypothetical protein [Paenibacillus pinihumi]|uniref:hypothetical protein n=1 Tax=Paenibacillus pinihumi TaxID=669462 RepID=UPI000415D3C7|nr:hypothetical protein [Paenibacillus pinihumi]